MLRADVQTFRGKDPTVPVLKRWSWGHGKCTCCNEDMEGKMTGEVYGKGGNYKDGDWMHTGAIAINICGGPLIQKDMDGDFVVAINNSKYALE